MMSFTAPLAFLPEGLDGGGLLALLLAAFAAGWVDAVVGGGGLLQLPALLLVPGMTPLQALATNKLASSFGSATSSISYYRSVRPNLRSALPMAGVALLSAVGGASLAAFIPAEVFKPVILVALVGVAALTVFKPSLGTVTKHHPAGTKRAAWAFVAGAGIGFYDGLLGPGTGTFLVLALVTVLGYDFLMASANAKIVNFATNVGSLILFIPLGAVIWPLGVLMGLANVLGSFIGSRMAVAKGARFVRVIFLIVVAALIAKLGADIWFGAQR
ncbi:TSUP family transporter [Leucobacter sp. CSA2]|uniref:Probable membrane transporter protein n=1 Tax=Leucobacter edaphi TaxID=2796472 RepID=A0A934QB22_9MICO|nr:TSUP family transporter [Leucobacter edaphi]MBK0421286.1 TSUP family transporter [Leucobacter edaphi]